MIGMEQVGLLERKVKEAVALIQQLRNENEYLRNRLGDYEIRIQELETLLSGLKASQNKIEEGILNAISDLNGLDCNLGDQSETRNSTPPLNDVSPLTLTENQVGKPLSDVEFSTAQPAPELGAWAKGAGGEPKSDEEPGLGIF